MNPLLVTNLVLLLALLVALGFFLSYRSRLHRLQGRDVGDPIPTVRLEDFDPLFAADELGPTTRAEAVFIGGGSGVPFGTSDAEAWVLAVLSKRARFMFEFGTASGRTAYLWARNSPPDAEVVTLTLPPESRERYVSGERDSRRSERTALKESIFTRFRYSGTDVEHKVTQLFGDSKALDEEPYLGRCDLIFVDGSHAYSYIRSDTEKALRMVAPGGIILWHDYRGPRSSTRDVYRFLNGLHRERPLVRLRGTSLVAYRADPPAA